MSKVSLFGEDGHIQWWQPAPSFPGRLLGCKEVVLPHYLPYVSCKDSNCCKTCNGISKGCLQDV